MYMPGHFREERTHVLHDTIVRIGFGTLVTYGPDGLEATHLPIHVDPNEGPLGTLYGHVARANAQWRTASKDIESLLTFTGPHAYISPSYYPSKREHGRRVPTWNYIAVHAYGALETIESPAPLLSIVSRLTDKHEAGRAHPWSVDDAPPKYIEGLLRAIIGIRMPIARLEGKWKLGQNLSPADFEGAAAGLEASETERELARIMRGLQAAPDAGGART
ncbi:FMN-binding negative transcriptional regulator [Pendulispora brunnea]|uniref:FMN-binding negative transcriptional regulator n=1 Tax=Pendulispora brunnea TaxID=2905690 RepID=A0ABZ2K2G7_9BACT